MVCVKWQSKFCIYALAVAILSGTELMTHGRFRHEVFFVGISLGVIFAGLSHVPPQQSRHLSNIAAAHGSLYIVPFLFCDSLLFLVRTWCSFSMWIALAGVYMAIMQILVFVYLWKRERKEHTN